MEMSFIPETEMYYVYWETFALNMIYLVAAYNFMAH